MKRSYTSLLNLFLWFCIVLVSLNGQSSAFQTGLHWQDSESSARSHDFKAGFGSATAGSLTGLLSRDIGTLRGLSSEELKNSATQLSANISQVSAGLLGADPNLGRQIGENVWEFNDRLEIQRVARRLEDQGLDAHLVPVLYQLTDDKPGSILSQFVDKLKSVVRKDGSDQVKRGQGLAIGTLNTITGRITLDPRVVGREGVEVDYQTLATLVGSQDGVSAAALNDFAHHPERDRNGDGYVDTIIDRQLQTLIAQNWGEVGRQRTERSAKKYQCLDLVL